MVSALKFLGCVIDSSLLKDIALGTGESGLFSVSLKSREKDIHVFQSFHLHQKHSSVSEDLMLVKSHEMEKKKLASFIFVPFLHDFL